MVTTGTQPQEMLLAGRHSRFSCRLLITSKRLIYLGDVHVIPAGHVADEARRLSDTGKRQGRAGYNAFTQQL